MVLTHQKFDLDNKPLIEKLIIQPPFRLANHFQDEACFIYFLEGDTSINSAGGQTQVLAEESVLLKCGSYFTDLMKNKAGNQYEILVFHLYPEILRKIYSNEIPGFTRQSENKSFVQKIFSGIVVKKFIESLYFYFENPALVSEELLKLKIKELVLLLIQTKNAKSVISLFSDLFTPRNLTLKEIINNHLFSELSIDDLASLANLSLSTFNRTFQTLFNDTPANYIKLKRLERAKELLGVSSLTISEVAFQTCFNDLAHFSRSFKAVYHFSPSAYRLSVQGQK